jgi:hypothetical protein
MPHILKVKKHLKRLFIKKGQQKESTPGDVMLIKKWRDCAASKRRSSLQQREVIEFFKQKKIFST